MRPAPPSQIFQGSLYVNDFNRFGRTWQVIVQADQEFRDEPEKLGLAQDPQQGRPHGTGRLAGKLALRQRAAGADALQHVRSASINGTAAPGMSSGDVINMVHHLAESDLAPNMSFEWTDMSYLELLAGIPP